MKKRIVAIILLLIAVLMMLCSCGNQEEVVTMEIDPRFSAEYYSCANIGYNHLYVITDSDTGVQYLFFKNGYGGGMTVLVDSDGQPLMK